MEGIEVEGLELQEAYFRGRKLQGTANSTGVLWSVILSFFLSMCLFCYFQVFIVLFFIYYTLARRIDLPKAFTAQLMIPLKQE
jgi:hypothetical protein